MTEHDPYARECIRLGIPLSDLHDRPCPACREMSALVDLDPDFGSAADGRPNLEPCGCPTSDGHRCKPPWLTDEEWGRT